MDGCTRIGRSSGIHFLPEIAVSKRCYHLDVLYEFYPYNNLFAHACGVRERWSSAPNNRKGEIWTQSKQ